MRAVAPHVSGLDEEMIETGDAAAGNAIVVARGAIKGVPIVLTRWRMNEAERDAILLGHDVFIVQYAGYNPMAVFATDPENIVIKEADHA